MGTINPFSNLQMAKEQARKKVADIKKSDVLKQDSIEDKTRVTRGKDIPEAQKSTIVQKGKAGVTDLGRKNSISASDQSGKTEVKTDQDSLENTLHVMGENNKVDLLNSKRNGVSLKNGNNQLTLANSENVSITGDESATGVYELKDANGSQIKNHSVNSQIKINGNSRYNQIDIAKNAGNAKVNFYEHSDNNTVKLNEGAANSVVDAKGGSDGNAVEMAGANSAVEFTKDADGSTVTVKGANSKVTVERADNLDITVNAKDQNFKVFADKNGKQYVQKVDQNGKPIQGVERQEIKDGVFKNDEITIRQKSEEQRVNNRGYRTVASADSAEYSGDDTGWNDAWKAREKFNREQGGIGELSDDIARKIEEKNGKYTVANGDSLEKISLGVYRSNNREKTTKLSDAQILKKHRPAIQKIQNQIAKKNGIKNHDLIRDGQELKLNGILKLGKEAQRPFATVHAKDTEALAKQINSDTGKGPKNYLGQYLGTVKHDSKATLYYENGALSYKSNGDAGNKNLAWKLESTTDRSFDKRTISDIEAKQKALDSLVYGGKLEENDKDKDGFLSEDEINAGELKGTLKGLEKHISTLSKAHVDYVNGAKVRRPDTQYTKGFSSMDITAIQNLLALGLSWDDIEKKISKAG